MSILADEVTVRKNTGIDIGKRRRLNFIEGANTILTVTDDPVHEEIDITYESLVIPDPGPGGVISATYVIYASGGTYHAANGLTGVVTSNANFADLMNSVMTNGATYVFKTGTYVLDKPIVVDENNIQFIGEGMGESVNIYCTTLTGYFDLHRPGAPIYYIGFKNLFFHGSANSISAITSQNQGSGDRAQGILITDCIFRYWTAGNNRVVYLRNPEMVEIRNTQFATYTATANVNGTMVYFDSLGYDPGNINFYNNELYQQMAASVCVQIVGTAGQYFESFNSRCNHFNAVGATHYDTYAYRITLTGSIGQFRSVSDRTESLSFLVVTGAASGGRGWKIVDGFFNIHSNITYPGIDIRGTGCRGTLIQGNTFSYVANDAVIRDDNNVSTTPTVVCDNQFYFSGSGSPTYVISGLSTCTVIHGNYGGYITEKSGSGSIPNGGTNVAILHGCNFTPNAGDIWITPTTNPVNDPGNIWVDVITANQFVVNCRNVQGLGGMPFRWQVRKAP